MGAKLSSVIAIENVRFHGSSLQMQTVAIPPESVDHYERMNVRYGKTLSLR
jgi:hypothetical protein